MTNKERIEAYFDNELSATEQEQLLRDIDTDPSLRSEFDFQKDVVDGIKAYRKQELINRLDNVKIVSAGQSLLVKTIGMIGLTIIISGGAYWYFGSSDQPTTSTIADQQTEQVVAEKPVASEQQEPVEKTPQLIHEKKEEAPISKEKIMQESKKENTKEIPDVAIPEMIEPESEAAGEVNTDLDVPKSMGSADISIKSTADVAVKLSKTYNFHYQVKNGDLTLFGDFDNAPFEVIELKTNKGISSFLYYNKYYYELQTDSEEIRPLVAIENEALINELNKRR